MTQTPHRSTRTAGLPDSRDWLALWMGWQAAFWMMPFALWVGEGTADLAEAEDAEWEEENLPV